MPSISDSVRDALKARVIGASNIQSGIATLDTALALQFRLHYHVFGAGLKPDVGRVLLSECKRLDTALNAAIFLVKDPESYNIIEKIIYNTMAVILYYSNQFDQADHYLKESSKAKDSSNETYAEFNMLLNLENLYYQGLILDRSIDGQPPSDFTSSLSSDLYLKNIVPLVKRIPSQSHGLVHTYLRLISKKLNIYNISELTKRVKAQDPLACYLSLVSASTTKNTDVIKANDKELIKIANIYLKESKFPMANEKNNDILEQFHNFLQYYFKNMRRYRKILSLKDWRAFIISSMQKTFQSKNVAKAAMIFFTLTGKDDKKEAILNFINFMKYSNNELKLSKDTSNGYTDPVSVIDAYTFIIQRSSKNDSIDNIYNFEESYDLFAGILIRFYDDYNLTFIEPKNSLDYLSNSTKLVLPKSISDILTTAWEMLYQIKATSLDYLISDKLSSYLCNAMSLISWDNNSKESNNILLNLQFEYAYCLAQERQIEQSIAFLESTILETTPTYYKAWHLLALCRSIQEDKESSYKIVCSVVNAMEQESEVQKFSKEDKWQYINLKITEIYLIDEIFGRAEALESLPGLFTAYNDSYEHDTNTEEIIENETFSQSKEYLLQTIWLLAAQLYMDTSEYKEDAREAINEARNISNSFVNINISIVNGYYLLKNSKLRDALKEFENALYYDDINADAIVGFAQILFPEEITNTSSEKQLIEYCKLGENTKPENNEKLMKNYNAFFVNEVDKSAAFARLKLLLDYSIVKSIDGFYSPETWWYLSLLHEKYGNREVEDTLLTCVKNKETCPIRPFKFCKY